MVRTSRTFPKNWENVKPISSVVDNTRFIVFKTPIDINYGPKLPTSKHFTTKKLLFDLNMKGQQLGLIINLSFTGRYYNPIVFDGICSYRHIYCCPAGYTKREDIVKRFISAVDSFLKRNEDNNLLIGVHCSDGINRSGYLICRYLIDKLHMGSDAALDAFEKARGHTINRGSCVQALHRAVAEKRTRDSTTSVMEVDDERGGRKRKAPGSGNDVLQQLAALEHHFSKPAETLIPQIQPVGPVPMQLEPDNRPMNIGPRLMPKKKKDEVEDGEFFEDDDEYEEYTETVEEGGEISVSKKRRLRRKQVERKYNIMKTGKFHLIQQVLQEEADKK